MRKKRVLFHSEATYLNTGYATYGREVIKRLIATGKYEVAEYSNYGSCDDHRRSSIPWKNYPVAPAKTDPEEVINNYRANVTHQFGSWRFERACLDFKPDIFCLPKGEPVLTDSGYVEIQDLEVGQNVLTHKNRFKPITKVMSRHHSGDIYEIYDNCLPYPLRVTGEHPVLIYRKKRQTNQKKSTTDIYKDEMPVFVEAKDIKVGDLLVLPSMKNGVNNDTICIQEFTGQYFNNYHKKFISEIKLDSKLALLCGYIAADGHVSDTGISVCFHNDEQNFIEDCSRLFSEIFGIESHVARFNNKNCSNVTLHSTILAGFFKQIINAGIYTVSIPKFVICGSDEVKEAFIRGFVRGDGCYGKNVVKLTTVNKKMALSYRYLLSSLGICSTITTFKYENGHSDRIDVCCHGRHADKLHQIVQKKESVDTPKNSTRSAMKSHILDNGYLVSRVSKINVTHYDGMVYNLSVKDDESYTSYYNTHNCTQMDPWMSSWPRLSPFRRYFSYAWASTVDAEPQHSEWINQFASCDYFYTLSDWATDVVKSQGGDKINLIDSVTGCAAEEFVPVPMKKLHKQAMGVNPDSFIVGTVMRNQRRKLFPDLFKAFAEFAKDKKDVYLYCHTSYPDNGWDLPDLAAKCGIATKVVFTYSCSNCGKNEIKKFSDALQRCNHCKEFSSKPSNVSNGASVKDLADIYNLFDCYIQCANSEGIGIPALEAASCGLPVIAVDYSAMSDIIRKIRGTPIPCTKVLEMETGCYRAIPDHDAMVAEFNRLFNMSEQARIAEGLSTRESYLRNYNWDVTTGRWMRSIDDCPYQEWDAPYSQITIPEMYPQGLSNKDFMDWCSDNIMPYENFKNTFDYACMLRDLNFRSCKPHPGGFFYSENSMDTRVDLQHFGHQNVIQLFKMKAEIFNFWENVRCGKIQLERENWLD